MPASLSSCIAVVLPAAAGTGDGDLDRRFAADPPDGVLERDRPAPAIRAEGVTEPERETLPGPVPEPNAVPLPLPMTLPLLLPTPKAEREPERLAEPERVDEMKER
jgi:hypothetical protein